MNNNSILINSYLQNEMSAEEKAAFEDRLASDGSLRNELEVQQRVINAVLHAGLKNEFANAIRKRVIIKRSVTWGLIIAASVLTFLAFNSRLGIFSNRSLINSTGTIAEKQETNIIRPFINPPLPHINVPVSEYSFNAEKGETLYYPSGSILYFPPSAFVDGSGNTVKGMVKISYREFADPLDFFVSGIPMQYDSAGTKYNFESSGMCEINAYKDGKAVFVNQRAKPEINLSGTNKSPLHNLYFLDTVNRKWEYTGKDKITELKDIVRSKPPVKNTILETEVTGLTKPLKPILASDDRQSFSIEIDPGSFEELKNYDGMKFEVVNEKSKAVGKSILSVKENIYNPSDANEHWDNVTLDHTATEGIYTVTFTNSRRKVSYKVRPVLEGSDYDAALKVFKEKSIAYEEALKNRQVNDKRVLDSVTLDYKLKTEKMNDDIAFNNKMNALIIARNKKMREEMLQGLNKEQRSRTMEAYLTANVIRTFNINNFGIWNCDQPRNPGEIPLIAKYTDDLNNPVLLPNIAVVYKKLNGIMRYQAQDMIRVMPGQENMIWAIVDSSFYYFTYKDFAATGIQKDTREFIFKMRSRKQIKSYTELREVVENL